MTAASGPQSSAGTRLSHIRDKLRTAVLTPVRAMRLRYLPLLMVYFAYGALGLDRRIARAFWIKESADLHAGASSLRIAVWLTLPWTIKMVFGELVDTVPIFGSQRRAYVYRRREPRSPSVSSSWPAPPAAGSPSAARPRSTSRPRSWSSSASSMQDVVADAMTTEVVTASDPDGTPRPRHEVERELGMVQVLGRLALSVGVLSVAGLSGWLARSSATPGRVSARPDRPGDLGHRRHSSCASRPRARGRSTGASSAAASCSAPSSLPSASAACLRPGDHLRRLDGRGRAGCSHRVTHERRYTHTQHAHPLRRLIIFCFRATPAVGEGYRWFTIDVLGFDEAFYGTLRADRRRLRIAGALAVLRCHHPPADRQGAALAHRRSAPS